MGLFDEQCLNLFSNDFIDQNFTIFCDKIERLHLLIVIMVFFFQLVALIYVFNISFQL